MDGTGLTGGRCELPPHTFRPCGLTPASGRDRVAACEVVEVASGITRELAQTAKLFAWVTGVGEIGAIDDDAITTFCERLGRIPARTGASPTHFDRPFDDVIGATSGPSEPARDASTIARHRSRMTTLRSVHVPEIEERVGPGYRVDLDGAECEAIAGWGQHAGFLAVTRLGRVAHGIPLPAFDGARSSGRAGVVRTLIAQADEGHAALTERGRAFVMTRHEGPAMRIVPLFWAARNQT